MVVRRDVDVAYAEPPLLAVHVSAGSEACDFRHAHAAGNVAEYFIVGAVLLDDQHHVLDAGRQRTLLPRDWAEAVGLHHERGPGRQFSGGGGQRVD